MYDIFAAPKLGEYVRVVLLELCARGAIFTEDDTALDVLCERGAFLTKYATEILQDATENLHHTRLVLTEDIGITQLCNTDLLLTRQICLTVSRRSARLAAAIVMATIQHLRKPQMIAGVDGVLLAQHPEYYDWLVAQVADLVSADVQLVLWCAVNEAARGAAALALAMDNL